MLLLPSLFSNGAILQRDRNTVVFGKGTGKVRVELGDVFAESETVGSDFRVTLPALPAGGPYTLRISDDDESLVFSDVYVGDVIVLAGQSNAALELRDTSFAKEDCTDEPLLRLFHVMHIGQPHPYDDAWVPQTVENAPYWSAVAYHVARERHAKTGVATGVILCAVGASVIQSFLSPRTSKTYTFAKELVHPDHDYEPYRAFNPPSSIYRFMVTAIVPYTALAVVWYQGESNTAVYEGRRYGEMLQTLIAEWRLLFEDPILPFAIVQINDFDGALIPEGWKIVQAEQARTAESLPACKLVTIRDLGQHKNIHPTNKRDVAHRVSEALAALLAEKE